MINTGDVKEKDIGKYVVYKTLHCVQIGLNLVYGKNLW